MDIPFHLLKKGHLPASSKKAEVEPALQCPSCQGEISEGEAACSHCHAPLNWAE